jgi:hypothetical protein
MKKPAYVAYVVFSVLLLFSLLSNSTVAQTVNPPSNIPSLESNTSNYLSSNSIALDSDGNPHISYTVTVNWQTNHYDLNYAIWNGSAWNIQAVEAGVGGFASLALDSHGNSHVSYISVVNGGSYYGNLTYAFLPSTKTATGTSEYNLSAFGIILGGVITGVVIALVLVLFFYKKPEPERKGKVKTAKEEPAVSQDESTPEPEQEQNANTKKTATQPNEEKT